MPNKTALAIAGTAFRGLSLDEAASFLATLIFWGVWELGRELDLSQAVIARAAPAESGPIDHSDVPSADQTVEVGRN